MSNARIQKIVTLLFVHRDIVGSQGIQVSESEELHKLLDRMFRNAGYYSSNPLVSGTFDFCAFGRCLTEPVFYGSRKPTLCTAYKSTVQTEQAMEDHGAGLMLQQQMRRETSVGQ